MIMRFAYLIMAHHRFDVLKELLKDLDDERNDIFLHIDKKTKNIPMAVLKGCVNKAHLEVIKPIKVYWGHSSQIQCVLNLLHSACKKGFHDYYHLLVGVEYPIVSQDAIYNFFEANNGKEFIGFDNHDKSFLNRVKYYHLFGKYARSNKSFQRFLFTRGGQLVELQKKLNINRIAKDDIVYRKGYANWSISDGLARYILNNESFIKKRMWLTSCADEVLFQTLIYNSEYRNKIYDINDEYKSCMRLTTWKNDKNRIFLSDVDSVIKSGRLFVRKIDGDDALSIISEIKMRRER